MNKDNKEFWIRDYFGPYPIDWDLYDIAMGRKPGEKTIDIISYMESEEYKNFFKDKKIPKK
jgi:hypothetical protein